jgi:ribosomal protein S18 acetylase RimI-like enzyme
MSRDEFDVLVSWASKEGWNPGLNDAEIFWQTDPEGFISAKINDELIGGGSIVSYTGSYGFMGFFIIKPEYRGKGLGAELWFHRQDRLKARLKEDAAIGMDGVFNMQPFYAKGGFEFTHREIRYEGTAHAYQEDANLQEASEVSFEMLANYDKRHFPTRRETFLKAWITQPKARSLVMMENETITGFGTIRPCETGYKVGPLFADNETIALKLFQALSNHAVGQPIFLDVPESNEKAVKMVTKLEMKEVFGCAKMYLGDEPKVASENIYGITTFELG